MDVILLKEMIQREVTNQVLEHLGAPRDVQERRENLHRKQHEEQATALADVEKSLVRIFGPLAMEVQSLTEHISALTGILKHKQQEEEALRACVADIIAEALPSMHRSLRGELAEGELDELLERTRRIFARYSDGTPEEDGWEDEDSEEAMPSEDAAGQNLADSQVEE